MEIVLSVLVISGYYKQKGGYSSKLASRAVQMDDFSELHMWCRMTLVEALVSAEFDSGSPTVDHRRKQGSSRPPHAGTSGPAWKMQMLF